MWTHIWGILWTITYGFHKIRGISWLAENRLVSQAELCSMEYVSLNKQKLLASCITKLDDTWFFFLLFLSDYSSQQAKSPFKICSGTPCLILKTEDYTSTYWTDLRKTAETLITESKTYWPSKGQYKPDMEINTQQVNMQYPESVSLNAKQVYAKYKNVVTKFTVLLWYEILRKLPAGEINRKTACSVTHSYKDIRYGKGSKRETNGTWKRM